MAVKDPREAIKVLNNLIETCKDGEHGFRAAADAVKSAQLKNLFGQYARQRALFAGELQAAVRRLQAEPQTTGSVAPASRRGWLNIKSLAAGKDDAAVIAECERGEDAALQNYREALNADLPSDLRIIVESQYQEVQHAHDRI